VFDAKKKQGKTPPKSKTPQRNTSKTPNKGKPAQKSELEAVDPKDLEVNKDMGVVGPDGKKEAWKVKG
jgi:hypothetical protein